MKTVITVFKKELLDTIRDRRTLMFMIVIPLLLFPILFKVMFSVQERQMKKAEQKILRVAFFDNGNASRLAEIQLHVDGRRSEIDGGTQPMLLRCSRPQVGAGRRAGPRRS